MYSMDREQRIFFTIVDSLPLYYNSKRQMFFAQRGETAHLKPLRYQSAAVNSYDTNIPFGGSSFMLFLLKLDHLIFDRKEAESEMIIKGLLTFKMETHLLLSAYLHDLKC